MIYQSPLIAEGRVTGEYGSYFGVYGEGNYLSPSNGHPHAGIDLGERPAGATPNGIRPVSPGIVREVSENINGLGYFVVIQHFDLFGNAIEEYSLYAHLASRSLLSVGDPVSLTSVVGTMGRSANGSDTGVDLHLHFSLHDRRPFQLGRESSSEVAIADFGDNLIYVFEDLNERNVENDGRTFFDNDRWADWVYALTGNDVVHGSQSTDQINGGLGNDTIYGNGGNDSIIGGSEYSDTYNDLTDDDDLRGGHGNDTIYGGAGNDTIYGGGLQSNSEADVIFGGSGDDHLFGEQGNDTIFGGSGDEVGGDTAYFEPVTRPGDEFLVEFQSDGGVRVKQVSSSNLSGITVNGTDTLYNVENISFGGLGRILRVADFASGDRIKVVPNIAVNPLLTNLESGQTLWLVSQASGPLFLQLPGSAVDYDLVSGSPSSGGEFAIRSVVGGQRFELLSGEVYVSIAGGQFQTLGEALTPIVATPDDHGDTRSTATLITDLDGTVVRGDIEVSGDEDYFQFSTQPGRTYGVVATPDNSGVNPAITVYNSSGQLVASNANLGSGPSAGLSFISSGGTYYVDISGEGGSTGDYGIGVSLLSDGSGGTAPGDASAPNLDINTTTSRHPTHEGDNGDNSWNFSSSSSTEVFIVMNGGDDRVRTGRRDDIVFGGDGDDEIETRAGNDTIDGGDGEDEIDGGDGNDGILGGRHDDTIDGGSGDDVIAGQHGDDRIDGGSGEDVISGGGGDDRIDGEDGDDGILGDDGDDNVQGGSGNDTIYGGNNDDIIDGEQGRDVLYGDRGDDFIRGGEDADRIDGGDGNDELFGEEGNDSISGGSGDDTIQPGSGDDTVDGDIGRDTLSYSVMNGGATIDMIAETAYGAEIGFDRFSSIDHIIGTTGNDIIIGDGDDNRLSGGSGQDILTGGAGNDEIDGGSSTDTAVFFGNRADYTITASTNPDFALQIIDNRSGSPDGTDLLASIAFLQFADVRIRDNDALSVAPTAVDDSFTVSRQGPAILSVLENDGDPDGNSLSISSITSQPSSGIVYVVDNRVVFEPIGGFSSATDQTVTFAYEVSDGTGWTDEATATVVIEAPAPDVSASNLIVEMRTDGSGLFDATFEVTNNGPDLLFGTSVALRLSDDATIYWEGDYFLGSVGTGELAFGSTVQLEIFGVDLDWVRTYGTFTAGSHYFAVEADYSDTLDESDEANNISNLVQVQLTVPNRTLTGGEGSDLLIGGAGNDTIYGRNGNDTLNGGSGEDFIFGGSTDADLRDVIYGGDGNDSIDGGWGNDDLNGGNGNDTVLGGFGSDTVIGNSGNDLLAGGAGSDLMFGNAGNDTLNGGFGFDRMNGGAGADSFFHLGIADHGSDWIQDYNAAEGDVLSVGSSGATRAQFQVNFTNTVGAGQAGVQEAFVIYRPTGQILWALIDGGDNTVINLSIGGQVFDLLA